MLLKIRFDNEKKTKVNKQEINENTIWPPSGHFQYDIIQNMKSSTHGHEEYANEVGSLYQRPIYG